MRAGQRPPAEGDHASGHNQRRVGKLPGIRVKGDTGLVEHEGQVGQVSLVGDGKGNDLEPGKGSARLDGSRTADIRTQNRPLADHVLIGVKEVIYLVEAEIAHGHGIGVGIAKGNGDAAFMRFNHNPCLGRHGHRSFLHPPAIAIFPARSCRTRVILSSLHLGILEQARYIQVSSHQRVYHGQGSQGSPSLAPIECNILNSLPVRNHGPGR